MKEQYRERYEKMGMLITFHRHKKKWTQKQLAAYVDVDPKHISGIENAAIGVSLDKLFAIADALEIEPWKLLYFKRLEDDE